MLFRWRNPVPLFGRSGRRSVLFDVCMSSPRFCFSHRSLHKYIFSPGGLRVVCFPTTGFLDARTTNAHRPTNPSPRSPVFSSFFSWVRAYFRTTRFLDRDDEMFVPLTSTKDPRYAKRRKYIADRVESGVDMEVRFNAHVVSNRVRQSSRANNTYERVVCVTFASTGLVVDACRARPNRSRKMQMPDSTQPVDTHREGVRARVGMRGTVRLGGACLV